MGVSLLRSPRVTGGDPNHLRLFPASLRRGGKRETYADQGRHVIPGYERYLNRLDHLKIPFRVGLLQGGEGNEPYGLSSNPWFRGYVVFLQNPQETGVGQKR